MSTEREDFSSELDPIHGKRRVLRIIQELEDLSECYCTWGRNSEDRVIKAFIEFLADSYPPWQ